VTARRGWQRKLFNGGEGNFEKRKVKTGKGETIFLILDAFP